MATADPHQNVFIIGDIEAQIVENQFPSKKQALKVLFFHLRYVKKLLRDALSLVIDEVQIFWKKGQIPTQITSRCVEKLEKLYNQWRDLQKYKGRRSVTVKIRKFEDDLSNLFDIGHGNVFNMIDQQQAEFLRQQRQPGRVGYIPNFVIDVEGQAKDELKAQQLLRSEMEKEMLGTVLEL